MKPPYNAPVVALDIDGTSGDYHKHFTEFIAQWTGRSMPDPRSMTGGIPFHEHLNVSRATYRQAKLAYRQGGMKRSMPAYEGVGELTKHIRKKGCQIWICTTRPYLRLDNIDPDTKHWLRRNGMQYDCVLYGEHKYRDLVSTVGKDRIVVVYDDLPRMVDQALALDLTALLRDQPYNRGYDSNGRWKRVGNVSEMKDAFDCVWSDWKKHNG